MTRFSFFTMVGLLFSFPLIPAVITYDGDKNQVSDTGPGYQLAFANFGPINTDIFIANADGSNPHPLLPHPSLDYNASFSKDGKWVLFTSERNGSADIYRVHPDGSGLEQLTNSPFFDDQAALSPDGKLLAFVSSRNGQAEIYILDIASKKLNNITHHPAGDFRPCWSPDGKWIAFSSDRDSKKPAFTFVTLHSTEIFKMRMDGTELMKLTNMQAYAGSPQWSADGKQLLIYEADMDAVLNITRVRRKISTTQVSVINLSDTSKKIITSDSTEKISPRWLADGSIAYITRGKNAGIEFVDGKKGQRGGFEGASWSADGRYMIFQRDIDNNWPPFQKVYSLDPEVQLLRTGIFPSFSPDGKKFICNDQTAGIHHNSILQMNVDGSNRSVLFGDSVKSSLNPVFSPKGDKIAFGIGRFFQSNLGPATADIAIINSDGSGLKIATDGTGNFGFPSWSPDGKKIVYRVSGGKAEGLSILDVGTGERKVLTSNSHDNFPGWSPKDDLIAFTSNRDGDYEIYTIQTDGTGLKRLTNSSGNEAHSVWSPDGKWIAFSSARGGFKDEAVLHPANPQPYGDIYIMRADGSDVRMLTDNQYEEATLGWAPVKKNR
jgi:TolB protein